MNTPFSGLAADGSKIALFNLIQSGYHVVAFIHDEFLIEIENDAGVLNREMGMIKDIMKKAMKKVVPDITIDVSIDYDTCWSRS